MSIRSHSNQALQRKVRDAVTLFVDRDPKLLVLAAHEQAFAHRIAIYLEAQFKVAEGLNVDCEYNKHLEKAKRIDLDLHLLKQQPQALLTCGCPACSAITKKEHLKGKLFRPDVVVHSRGNDDHNIIVIEIKSTGVFCPFDGAKLEALTAPKTDDKPYEYQLGVFILFGAGAPSFEWYPAVK